MGTADFGEIPRACDENGIAYEHRNCITSLFLWKVHRLAHKLNPQCSSEKHPAYYSWKFLYKKILYTLITPKLKSNSLLYL